MEQQMEWGTGLDWSAQPQTSEEFKEVPSIVGTIAEQP